MFGFKKTPKKTEVEPPVTETGEYPWSVIWVRFNDSARTIHAVEAMDVPGGAVLKNEYYCRGQIAVAMQFIPKAQVVEDPETETYKLNHWSAV